VTPPEPALDPATAEPTIRVVTVTYSPGDALEDFLTSLETASQRPLTVLLADNGSTDGTPEAAAATGRAILRRTGGNVGYGAAANFALADATEEWLVVANPDIVWQPGSLDTMLAASARWPRAGVLGPGIGTPDGLLYPSARALPSLGRGIGHAVFGWFWPTNPWTRAYRREEHDPVEGLCGWLSGSCMLIRREAFEAVGGFDPSYFMFFEDVDLCERIGKAGWQIVYVPLARVEHVGGHSWRDQPGIMVKAHHASAIRYLTRKYDAWWQWPLRTGLKLGLGLRWALSTLISGIGRGAEPTRELDA
jgi:N-acetylglucosaminyl-diphospho-decaprenol L-rhamnosyltransferase